MKIGVFNVGNKKEDNGKAKVNQIAGLQDELKDRTNNLKQTEKKLKKLSGNNDVKPHGPLSDLTLDGADTGEEGEAPEVQLPANPQPTVQVVDGIKMVEVRANPTAPPPPPAASSQAQASSPPKKDTKTDSIGDNLNALFAQVEEEENPLASLIKTLPEVEVTELMEDLKEIKDIIKDWQKK
jgi:hypothetical protein